MVFWELGVWGIVMGPLVGKAIVLSVFWWRLALELPPSFDRSKVMDLLRIGMPLTPRVFLGVLDRGIDRLLLKWLNSLGQVGLFALGDPQGHRVYEQPSGQQCQCRT